MDKRVLILILLLIIFNSNCFMNSEHADNDFYNFVSRGDLWRIPLIEPHELISADHGATWFYYTHFGDLGRKDISRVTKFSRDEQNIIIYSERLPIDYKMSEAWFVYNLKDQSLNYFLTEEEFINFYKCRDKLKWYLCKDSYILFKEKGEHPWLSES